MLRLLLFVSLVPALAVPALADPPELQPIDGSQWDLTRARHLLNRVGFGPTPAEVVDLATRSFDEAIAHVLDYDEQPAHAPFRPNAFDASAERWQRMKQRATYHHRQQVNKEAREALERLLDRAMRPGAGRDRERPMKPRSTIEGLEQRLKRGVRLTSAELARLVEHRSMETLRGRHRYEWHMQLRNHWLRRMVSGRRPLQEKMTLFWHGHFTSSMAKVRDSEYMIRQQQLFRRHATGNFAALLKAVAVDPAMLIYLDGAGSHKRKPNENWARELLELYTLGIGHYTEADIAAAARAFTGWTWNEPFRHAYFQHRTLRFERRHHDDGPKTFLGRTGRWDGDDVLRILLEHPATARRVCGKLCRFFLGRSASPAVVEALAAQLRREKYALRPVLERLLRSRLFYDRRTIGARIKSPTELLVGTMRALGVQPEDLTEDPVDARMRRLDDVLRLLGQQLLYPPTVKGWEGGRLWINAATTLLRHSLLTELLSPPRDRRRYRMAPDEPILTAEQLRLLGRLGDVSKDPARLVDHLIARFVGRPLAPARRARLLAVLAPGVTDARVRQVLLLLTSMPEYQLS